MEKKSKEKLRRLLVRFACDNSEDYVRVLEEAARMYREITVSNRLAEWIAGEPGISSISGRDIRILDRSLVNGYDDRESWETNVYAAFFREEPKLSKRFRNRSKVFYRKVLCFVSGRTGEPGQNNAGEGQTAGSGETETRREDAGHGNNGGKQQ